MGTATKIDVDRASTARDYDHDFYSWTQDQAAALRAGRVGALDIENLAEEIESLGKEQFSKLESALRVILRHMLEWDHQPERRSRSWVTSIRTQRFSANSVLKDNPGLKSRTAEALERAYHQARIEAAAEMRRPERSLPMECPYPFDEVLSRPVDWPDA